MGPLLDEHVADNFGELLPHVFFGRLTDWVERLMAGASARKMHDVQQILNLLEEAIRSDDFNVRGLISVSFLESLDSRAAGYSELRAAMGPNLLKELSKYEDT